MQRWMNEGGKWMNKSEIDTLLRTHLSGVRSALNDHLDGIERALATHIEAMDMEGKQEVKHG